MLPPVAQYKEDPEHKDDTSGSTEASTMAPDMESPKNGKLWEGLEPMYRRFLRDAGVSKTTFEAMPPLDKVSMRDKFDKIVSHAFGSRTGMKGVPTWAVRSSVTLAEATHHQLVQELQRRLEGTADASVTNLCQYKHPDMMEAAMRDQTWIESPDDLEAEQGSLPPKTPRREFQI